MGDYISKCPCSNNQEDKKEEFDTDQDYQRNKLRPHHGERLEFRNDMDSSFLNKDSLLSDRYNRDQQDDKLIKLTIKTAYVKKIQRCFRNYISMHYYNSNQSGIKPLKQNQGKSKNVRLFNNINDLRRSNDMDRLSIRTENQTVRTEVTHETFNNNFKFGNKIRNNYSGSNKVTNSGVNKVRNTILGHYSGNRISIDYSDSAIEEILKQNNGKFGIVKFRDGKNFTGYMNSNGIPDGFGTICLGREIYIGEFFKGRISNFGHFVNSADVSYEGEWYNEQLNGIGVEQWSEHCIFLGEFYRGLKNGIGVYSWQDGSNYVGEWQDNTFHGYVSSSHYRGFIPMQRGSSIPVNGGLVKCMAMESFYGLMGRSL